MPDSKNHGAHQPMTDNTHPAARQHARNRYTSLVLPDDGELADAG